MSFLQLLLIHFDADCTQPDSVGNTPLHMCVDSGHEDVSYSISYSIVDIYGVKTIEWLYSL